MKEVYRAIRDMHIVLADTVCLDIKQDQLFALLSVSEKGYLLQRDWVTFGVDELIFKEGFRVLLAKGVNKDVPVSG